MCVLLRVQFHLLVFVACRRLSLDCLFASLLHFAVSCLMKQKTMFREVVLYEGR